jgi:peroxiredoxin Q/BCP
MKWIPAILLLAAFQDPPKIEKGEKAPDFAAKNQKGEEVKLSTFKEKRNVLLAFYPKDFTGG